MSTATDIIKASLRKIGAIAPGETPTASEITDGLADLNRMLDSWSNESLLIYSKVQEEFSLVANQQSYTMGSSANFDTSRPQKIENAYCRITSGSETDDLPIKMLSQDEWDNITSKSITSDIPTKLYVDYSYPNATLYFWPKPSAANSVVLHSWKPLTSFASSSANASFPPGYEDAIIYNLAVRLAPDYGRVISPEVAMTAMETKEVIKRMNIKPMYMGCDLATLPRHKTFNYLTGE